MSLGPVLLGAALQLPLPAAPAPVPLSLTAAWQQALSANPALGATDARAAADDAAALGASRALWPRLSVSSSALRTDNAALAFMARLNAADLTPADLDVARLTSPDAVNHLTTVASVEIPLDLSGRLRRERQRALALAASAAQNLGEARLEIRLGVESAYWRAWLDTHALQTLERALQAARARRETVDATVSAGAVLRADLLRARARERQRQAGVAAGQAAAETGMATLARWMGVRDTAYVLSDAPPAPIPLPGTRGERRSRATASRPLVRSAQDRLRASAAALDLEKAGTWPDLSAYAQGMDDRGSAGGGRRSYAAGLNLRWIPFDPARGARRAQLEAERRVAQLDVTAAEDEVALEVAAAWARALSARERQAAAQGGAEEGQEAARVVRERRTAGLATLTDELETESASLLAELEELTATVDIALADAALRRAVGIDEGDQP